MVNEFLLWKGDIKMQNYIKQEFRRAFFSKKTLIMYLVSIALFFIGMYQYIQWLPSQSVSIMYTFCQAIIQERSVI